MPLIKRWFHCSQDINADPEFWELRKLHGDRAGFIWLEILAIADRQMGLLGPDSPELHAILAGRCRVYSPKVRAVLMWCLNRGWLQLNDGLRVTNWLKYNRIRVPHARPSPPSPSPSPILLKEEDTTSSPFPEKEPPKKRSKVTPGEWPSPEALIELYNAEAADELPAVTKLSEARRAKARKYLAQFPEMDFWREVFKETRLSPFLRGLKSNNGHGGFKGDLDWLLTKGQDGTENCVKVFEGKYRDAKT